MMRLAREQQAAMRKLVAGLDVKAEKIRTLERAGYRRSDIARFLAIRYQHVRNVLVRAETKREEQARADDVQPPRHEWAAIGPDGRVVVPAAYRKLLGLESGGQVLMLLDDGEVRLVGRDAAIRRAQELVARYVPRGAALSDELIAERRAEAARESGRESRRS